MSIGNDDKISESSKTSPPSINKFLKPGILLYIDQLIVAAGGWIYWLVVSKLTTSTEIGQATIVYSLVILATAITQLGLEYPLLRKASIQRSHILGTALALEFAITLVSIPIVLAYIYSTAEQPFLQDYAWLAVGIILLSSLGFVLRFALLGISDVRNVLLFDMLGIATKFISGFIFVFAGFGASGILISFLLQAALLLTGTLMASRRQFRFRLGTMKFAKELLSDSFANMPSKMSKMVILSLSIVLLTSLGTSSSDAGVFYITVMVSIAAGALASSLATMVLPASVALATDMSSKGLRLGLSLTAPIIVALLVAPAAILSLIGPEYEKAVTILVVLSLGILPSAVITNTISKLNNSGKSKDLLLLGISQLAVFLFSFYSLVPQFGVTGAAFSMLFAFACSSIICIRWLDKDEKKYIVKTIAAIAAGYFVAFLLGMVSNLHFGLSLIASLLVCAAVIFKLGNTSPSELKQIILSFRIPAAADTKG